MDSITQALGGDTMKQISRQRGTDEGTTQPRRAAVPMLLAGRRVTARAPASALHGALSAKDHDGESSTTPALLAAQVNPGRHPGHVGGHQPLAEEGVEQQRLDRSAGQLLRPCADRDAMIGRARQQKGLDSSGPRACSSVRLAQRSPGLMGLHPVVDKNGDG